MASEGSSLFQRKYIDYIYMPGALLVLGTVIVKKEWAPYAALLAVVWGLYNFNAMRESFLCQYEQTITERTWAD